MPLYECRNCGIVATERKNKCPACGSSHGSNGQGGTAFGRLSAKDLMEALK